MLWKSSRNGYFQESMAIRKLSARLRIILILLIVLIGAILFSIPIIAEYYLEKNDVSWIGREVEVTNIDLNIFTGKIAVYNGFIFEKDGTTPFVDFESLEANVRLLSLFSSIIEFEYIHLSNINGRIVQDGNFLNTQDLGPAESPDTNDADSSAATKVIINDLRLEGGTLSYTDRQLGSKISLDQIRLLIPLISYERPDVDFNLSARQQEGGDLNIAGILNVENTDYAIDLNLDAWQLRPYKNYLNSYLAIQDFAGLLNVELKMNGNAVNAGTFAAKSTTSVTDFLLVDNNSDSLITWKNLRIFMDSVNTAEHIYDLGQTELVSPSLLFRYFEEGDSFSALLLDTAATQTLDTVRVAESEIVFQNPFQFFAEYIYYLVDEDVFTTYAADSMRLEDGRITFHDYSHLQDATILLEEMDLSVPQVLPTDSTLDVMLSSTINKSGKLTGEMILYRTGLSNFGLNISITDLYVTAFDPYSRYYTAFPIWEGKMKLTNKSTVRNYELNSVSEVFVENMQVGRKLDQESAYNIPLRFAVSLLKDVNGNIDIEVPVEGNLQDPEYKMGKVILKVIMNLLSKAVASPYNLLARAFDADEDDLKSIRFENGQDSLANEQIKTLDLTARILERKPELRVKLGYVFNEIQEKEAIALKRAKQQYVKDGSDSIADWTKVDISDSLFVVYLDERVGGLGERSVESMCIELVGSEGLDARVSELRQTVRALVADYLYSNKQISPERAQLVDIKADSVQGGYLKPTFLVKYDVMDSTGNDSSSGPPQATDSLSHTSGG